MSAVSLFLTSLCLSISCAAFERMFTSLCLSISSSNYNLYTFQTNFIPVLSSSYEGISSGSPFYYFPLFLFKLVYHSFFQPLESVLYQIIPPPLKTPPPRKNKIFKNFIFLTPPSSPFNQKFSQKLLKYFP